MEQNHKHVQQRARQHHYISVQALCNNVLKQMAAGDIKNTAELLYTIKQQWKHIDINQFDVVYHYVTTMIAVMDESLKLYPAFPLKGQSFNHYIEGVYVAGQCAEGESLIEVWIFLTGSNEWKQRMLHKVMHLLEITYQMEQWVLKGIDLTTGERFLRMKHENK
ncbi:hypothetical protein D7Z54_19770 [Salibacterium salarium]|uniref:Uncharacterized protein n=1 Tax=Salibacterium salarium TaxID=284579 RepID=A0A428N065_9BACI|nr:hypothetical protein [Salibacterium salarium]RSL31679.1 hypothetical protein D7Z54_19770 [Salibacterium salarium]